MASLILAPVFPPPQPSQHCIAAFSRLMHCSCWGSWHRHTENSVMLPALRWGLQASWMPPKARAVKGKRAMAIHPCREISCMSNTLTSAQKKRNTRQAVNNHSPHYIGKGATLVLGTIKLLHQKKKEKINGDQEGCRLDLKPPHDESWSNALCIVAFTGFKVGTTDELTTCVTR